MGVRIKATSQEEQAGKVENLPAAVFRKYTHCSVSKNVAQTTVGTSSESAVLTTGKKNSECCKLYCVTLMSAF